MGVDGDPIAELLATVRALPAAAVAALFARYGKPLSVAVSGAQAVELALEDGGTAVVRAVRIRMPVDVIANDFFIWEVPGQEALAMPGPLFAAAVAAIAAKVLSQE